MNHVNPEQAFIGAWNSNRRAALVPDAILNWIRALTTSVAIAQLQREALQALTTDLWNGATAAEDAANKLKKLFRDKGLLNP